MLSFSLGALAGAITTALWWLVDPDKVQGPRISGGPGLTPTPSSGTHPRSTKGN
jgi:hypothetical protein